ncbi:MAG: FAD-binding protein, partial [Acidimicrobiales bacterium]
RVEAQQVACGSALVAALLEGCLARGIEPTLATRATELIMRHGAVAGLVVERDGQRVDVLSRAVVLASGGYEWNSKLCSRFLPGPLTHPTSPPGNEGDGLLMAMEVGADLANMNEAWWYPAAEVPDELYDGRQLARFVAVERTAPHSIMVDRFGHRFVNEAANYNDMQKAFFAFDANEAAPRHLPCWVVFDQQYRSRYPVINVRPGAPDPPWLIVHDTLDGLAAAAGIDASGLRESVQRWNGLVTDGRDRDFGRGDSFYDRFHGDPTASHPNLGSIGIPPYYALPVHLGAVGTSGGPRIDAHGRVQHVRDRPIPGLYGAGNAIASPAGPAYFGGGTTIGMALVWGHIAGAAAGTYVRQGEIDG